MAKVTTHTLGSTTRPYGDLSYLEAFEHVASAGYTDVAIFSHEGRVPVHADSSKAEVAAVRDAAAKAGLTPSMLLVSVGLDHGLPGAIEAYKRLIDRAADTGVRWLLDCGTNDADYENYYKLMRQVVPYATRADLRITMKPHGGISVDAEHLLTARNQVGHPDFSICYDPGNIIYYTMGQCRPETDVAKIAPHVSTVIIKDCVIENGKADVMVTPGDGLVDFTVVLRQLIDQAFAGPLYVECVGSRQVPLIDRDLAFTRGYVRGILAAL